MGSSGASPGVAPQKASPLCITRLNTGDACPGRIVNLHPALLPSFKGAHAIQDAFDYGVMVTDVTVHFADDKYDCGPIIAQRALPVEEGWDVDTLEEHIHAIARPVRSRSRRSRTSSRAWRRSFPAVEARRAQARASRA